MTQITIETLRTVPVGRRRFEHVERKGIGHPDTICDGVAEAIEVAMCREYLKLCGRVLHCNADKALLAAGRSSPRLGGGTIDAPMRLFLGDRATSEIDGRPIDVDAVAEATARDWLRRHLRFVDVERDVRVQSVLQAGSVELTDLFARSIGGANDTSIGVGCAPLTETERITLEAERRLNSPGWKERYPEIGEDVKVMTIRRDRRLALTVAAAFVDRFLPDARTYYARKTEITAELERDLRATLRDCDDLEVALNVLDEPSRDAAGMYLTVTGTSAEGADSGQVGRGNRANGLISPHRSMSLEAVAGKNPVAHVGKIYNVLALRAAERIVDALGGAAEATVWICSRIGSPLDQPWSTFVELVPTRGGELVEAESTVRAVVEHELGGLSRLMEQLTRGEIAVY